MAQLAVELRPALATMLVLGIAAAPWRHADAPAADVSPMLIDGDAAVALVPMTIDAPDPGPMPNAYLPGHPDMRPWPHGMVIAPPSIDSGILLWRGSPLDTLLSVFLSPLALLDA